MENRTIRKLWKEWNFKFKEHIKALPIKTHKLLLAILAYSIITIGLFITNNVYENSIRELENSQYQVELQYKSNKMILDLKSYALIEKLQSIKKNEHIGEDISKIITDNALNLVEINEFDKRISLGVKGNFIDYMKTMNLINEQFPGLLLFPKSYEYRDGYVYAQILLDQSKK